MSVTRQAAAGRFRSVVAVSLGGYQLLIPVTVNAVDAFSEAPFSQKYVDLQLILSVFMGEYHLYRYVVDLPNSSKTS